MLAGIYPTIATRRTLATVGIRVAGNDHARLQPLGHIAADSFYDGTYFMTRNDWVKGHRVPSHEGIEVRTTETYVLQLQQHLASLQFTRLLHVDDIQFLLMSDLYCFHNEIELTLIMRCKSNKNA